MKIIFCQDPFNPLAPAAPYIDEVAAVTHAGLSFEMIRYQSLVDEDNPVRAVLHIPATSQTTPALYRGWPLTVLQYSNLYDALLSRGLRLLNSAEAYRHTQILPESLDLIHEMAPRTVWTRTRGEIAYEPLMLMLRPFGHNPVIVRDFVKSQKHYWHEACYIPDASNREQVEQVVGRFIELRGEDFTGGLVFREYVELEPLSEPPAAGMPLVQEFRLFYFRRQHISTVRYWNVEDYSELQPPVEVFEPVARRVRSSFFTMDVARRRDGSWIIIDLGDGQVAPLPDTADADQFYRALAENAPES